jgi:hypothetical protein
VDDDDALAPRPLDADLERALGALTPHRPARHGTEAVGDLSVRGGASHDHQPEQE